MNEDTKKALEQKFGDQVQETKSDLIIASHELIMQGLPVYLMQPNSSIPYAGTHGSDDAVTDYKELTQMFIDFKADSNIGVNLKNTGIVVLDVDKHSSNGFRSLIQSGHTLNLDDQTWEKTPRGAHVFFKIPKGLNVNDLKHVLLDGVELLKGHATMAPSSRIIDGQKVFYKHFGGKITDCEVMPQWLIKLASNVATSGNKQTKRVPKYSIQERWQMVLDGFTEGERNNMCVSLSGYLLRINVDPNTAYAIVKKVNENSDVPLADKEVETIYRSAYQREKQRRLGGH